MELSEAIYKRRTVRDFQEKPIPLEVIKKIVAAGTCAPSNDHLRRWEFIVVQEKEKRCELVKLMNAPQTKKAAIAIVNRWRMTDTIQRDMYIDAIPKQHAMIINAGCLILPCFYHKGYVLKPKALSSLNGFASIWCCTENILLTAVAEGIFGVTRIPFEEERKQLKSALQVPDDYEIPCYLALGYPQEGIEGIKQIEVNIEERIHHNAW
jgi:nitroreductase